MRRLLTHFSLIVLCALTTAGGAAMASTAIPPLSSQSASQNVHIAPHRAIYTMSLASVKNGGNIVDASGRMLFEWRDMCDGWAIQQHMQLHFTYNEGDDQDITSTELTWESKDGKSYNFNIHRLTDGKETENYRGKAIQNRDGTVSVTYSIPEGKTLSLPAGTIFPSTHTQLMLQKAAAGEKFFSRNVFDGTDDEGTSDISAFITPPSVKAQDVSLPEKTKSNALLSDVAWPVHLAFFQNGSETGEPDYEMDLSLLPNGIARHMKIDYGDFAVNGALSDIEPIPSQSCP